MSKAVACSEQPQWEQLAVGCHADQLQRTANIGAQEAFTSVHHRLSRVRHVSELVGTLIEHVGEDDAAVLVDPAQHSVAEGHDGYGLPLGPELVPVYTVAAMDDPRRLTYHSP